MWLWISCGLTGLALGVPVWLLARPLGQSSAPAPQSARPLQRLIWPWIAAMAAACDPFLSWPARNALAQWLGRAGMPAYWQPKHYAAFMLWSGLAGAAVAAWLVWDQGLSFSSAVPACLAAGTAAGALPWQGLRRRARQRQHDMLRELPFLLDITTLCVEAGMNLQGALQQAARYGPPGPLREELGHALADVRAGLSRQEALRRMAQRTGLPVIHHLVTALAQADQLGSSLGPLLRAQSEQRRQERFLRAEKLAQEAPVKMLFPLVTCIFPCTFLIIGFPIAVRLLGAGWS